MNTFGPYELRSLLGRGGMGEVHEAFDTEHRRRVALKLLPLTAAADETFAERFRRESFAVAQLNDPHVIPIHRYGELEGRLYLDMRLVDGLDLRELLRREGALAPGRAVALVTQAAHALDAAHAEGLIHRDVKPSNLLVTRHDHLYLVDFGIAHIIGAGDPTLTGTGATLGTLDYMAPERFVATVGDVAARGIDPTADVYSLACVLYEMLTGHRPFLADEPAALMHAHLRAAPPAVSSAHPGLPVGLDAVISRGMAKDPARRHPTAGALAEHARAVLADHPGSLPSGGGAPSPLHHAHTSGAYAGEDTSTGRGWMLTGETPVPSPKRRSSPRRRGVWVAGALILVAAGTWAGRYALTSTPDEPVPAVASPSVSSAPDPLPTTSPPVPATEPVPVDDLGLAAPISTPACDGEYVTFVGSAVVPESYPDDVAALLVEYTDSSYLKSDACASLRVDDGGTAIYSVFLGPFRSPEQACVAQTVAGGDSYVRVLDDVTPPGRVVFC